MKKTGPISKIVHFKMTSILLLFFLCLFIILSLWFQHKLDQSQKRRYLSYVTADELRQSSDDLTRMVRTYVITKDSRYEKMYWDILAIRNGEKARPLRYENIYWDFVALTKEKPRPDGQKIPLLKIMEDLAFTQEEFAKLTEAEMHSNNLVKKEMIAMHAMKGEFLDAEGEFTLRGKPDYDYARVLLYDESYHSDKVDIMTPIDEFFVLVHARTEAQVHRDTIYTYICIFLVYATITLLLLLSRAELNERKKTEKAIKESEEKYRTLFERESDAIFIYDPDTTNILDANKATSKMYGYDKDELIGMSCLNFSAEVKESASLINGIRKEDEVNVPYRLHRKKDGTVFPVDIIGYAITLGGENVMYAVSKDVSDRKKLEEERQKIHKLKSIGILAGGIAHDFNNLLAAIRNNIYLAMMHVDHENIAYENLESTENIIHRATNLTQQLLTFSKGGTPVKKTASIVELIKESAEFILKGSNVECECNMADNTWPVDVDEGQMNQVIHNLVLNAVQSMPKGGAIRISAENSNLGSDTGLPLKEGRYVKISIQDQGVGIAEDHLKNVFDPYFTTKDMGHGLGLSITYSIIKKHDGHIYVKSEIGTGTTLTIYLPASEKQIEEKDTAEDTFAAGDGKVLIMDDEEIIRESVEQLLTYKGYEIECAKDGEEAIGLYKKAMEASKPFDAVILDLTIRGGMGGKETVKKLLEIDPDVKAIVASGYSNDPVLANYKDYGFVGVFAKHDKTEELGKTLHKVINGYQ